MKNSLELFIEIRSSVNIFEKNEHLFDIIDSVYSC